MENKKQNYNKETLYKVYLEMKKDACEGLKYMESLKEEIWGGDDENCKVIVSIVEGSMVSNYRIIIPDKNIDETFDVNVSECLDKEYYKTHADDLFYYRYPYFPIFPLCADQTAQKLNTEAMYKIYLEMNARGRT